MKLFRISVLIMALVVVLGGLLTPAAFADGSKRRIAVLPFEYGAVQSWVGSYDVGKGITSMLVTKLVEDGTFSVIEREALDQVLKEQNLSLSGRADPETAVRIGKLLNVDAIVVGTVTEFGFENKHMNVGTGVGYGAGYIPYVGGLVGGLGGVGKNKSKAKVSVDARLVDINTSEILATAHGTGMSSRSGMSLYGGYTGVDFGSSGFESTIAGEATIGAVDDLKGQMLAWAAKIPDNKAIALAGVTGKIADVTGKQVIINLGKTNGMSIGDNLQVEQPFKTVKDPTTGKVIKEMSNTVAIVKLSEIDTTSSTGDIIKGSGVRVGDTVRKVTTDVSAVLLSPPQADPASQTSITKSTVNVIRTVKGTRK
jgi:curli biogenesis system outer membrane secretion channel CsgG